MPSKARKSKGKTPIPKPRRSLQQKQKSSKPKIVRRRQMRRSMTAMPSVLSKYLMCRADPLEHAGGVGIPDQSAGKRIVVDVRQYLDFTLSSAGSLAMVMIPSPSNPLIIKETTAATTGGIANYGYATRSTSTTRPLNTSGSWISVPPSQYQSYLGSSPVTPTTGNHPYYATGFRIVSQAARIIYTGRPFEASGLITITPNSTSSTDTEINSSIINRYTAAGTLSTTPYAANTVLTRYLNFNFTSEPVNGTVTTKLIDGAYILNKRLTPVSTFIDTGLSPTVLCEEDRTTCLLGDLATASGNDVVSEFDPSFMTPSILITGGTPGETFRVEMVTCVEYMLDPRSTFAPLAVDRPLLQPALVSNVDAKIAQLPLASTPSKWQDIIGTIMETGLSAAGTVMGGPVLGAAIGTVTGAFRRLWT